MKLTLPLMLTLGRVMAIPVVMLLFFLPVPYARQAAAVVFILASITDWLDGFLARRWQQESRFGAFLDPVADKLLVAVSLVLLLYDRPGVLLALITSVIIGREIAVSALREWMAEIGTRRNVAVSWLGKLKTGFQMTAIAMMLWQLTLFGLPLYTIGFALLIVAAVLTLQSMIAYLQAAWPALSQDDQATDA
ncbi:CDP-diacylglycerol--glycerol-3-phosphate 3-phosphatidyltransferase [Algiphilus sp.]|uniref:CDP-diacylglycerol--glycerol-3-phosphate 3-phosphatidyltransferase n=1 Tax=Algiphilus sp. TaxID=1872431 RepID=UPI002A62D62C|nr:CDP-diacylglycerol--glycerol-3-phosphate 3-phosphatidyltransferase [Pseudomonadota bacterium]